VNGACANCQAPTVAGGSATAAAGCRILHCTDNEQNTRSRDPVAATDSTSTFQHHIDDVRLVSSELSWPRLLLRDLNEGIRCII